MYKVYWMNILMTHLTKYPLMTIQDMVKLVHQACFGPKHFSGSITIDKIEAYLINELHHVKSHVTSYVEAIGNDYYRVYLQAVLDKKVEVMTLSQSFYLSMIDDVDVDYATAKVDQVLDIIIDLVEKRQLPFSLHETKCFIDEYKGKHYSAMHHSDIYQQAYEPHYRVIHKKYLNFI